MGKTTQEKATLNNTLKYKKQRIYTQDKERKIIIKTTKKNSKDREKNEQINSKQKRAKRKKNFNNNKSNTNTKIEEKKSITPRDNNPSMEMNEEHSKS